MKKIKQILENPNVICACFACFAVLMMIYHLYVTNHTHLYVMNGFDDEISFNNGTLYVGTDINYFNGASILYIGDDELIENYTIGYYYEDGTSIIEISDNESDDLNIKSILEYSNFSFTEKSSKNNKLSIKSIENTNSIYFKIIATCTNGKKIEKSIKLDIKKITN